MTNPKASLGVVHLPSVADLGTKVDGEMGFLQLLNCWELIIGLPGLIKIDSRLFVTSDRTGWMLLGQKICTEGPINNVLDGYLPTTWDLIRKRT